MNKCSDGIFAIGKTLPGFISALSEAIPCRLLQGHPEQDISTLSIGIFYNCDIHGSVEVILRRRTVPSSGVALEINNPVLTLVCLLYSEQ